MKKFAEILMLGTILSLVFATGGSAQGPNWGGWGPKEGYGRMYNPATVETLSGQVEKVERFTPGKGMGYGVHLVLKTGQETIDVHLGPFWYVEKQGLIFAPGDKVEVTGSRVTYQEKPAIIAGEVKKGGQVLKLRDAAGVPLWAGQRWQ